MINFSEWLEKQLITILSPAKIYSININDITVRDYDTALSILRSIGYQIHERDWGLIATKNGKKLRIIQHSLELPKFNSNHNNPEQEL